MKHLYRMRAVLTISLDSSDTCIYAALMRTPHRLSSRIHRLRDFKIRATITKILHLNLKYTLNMTGKVNYTSPLLIIKYSNVHKRQKLM